MENHRRKLLIVAALLVPLVAPAGVARARHASWRWTPAQRRQVQALEKQVVGRADGFYVLTSGRFDIHTDISARFAAETSLFMDGFYSGFSRYLFRTVGAPRPMRPALRPGFVGEANIHAKGPIYFPRKPTVVVFANPADYRKHFKNGSGAIFVYRYNAKGKYSRFHIYAQARTPMERRFAYFPISALMHEATHCLLQAMAGRGAIPPWFNEGFAQLVDSCNAPAFMGGELKPRGKFWRRHALKYPGHQWYKKAPSLSKLIALKTWNVDKMGRETRYRYALAQNFTEFLFSTDAGKAKLRLLLSRLIRRQKPLLNDRDSWDIERQWHVFLRKSMEENGRRR